MEQKNMAQQRLATDCYGMVALVAKKHESCGTFGLC